MLSATRILVSDCFLEKEEKLTAEPEDLGDEDFTTQYHIYIQKAYCQHFSGCSTVLLFSDKGGVVLGVVDRLVAFTVGERANFDTAGGLDP